MTEFLKRINKTDIRNIVAIIYVMATVLIIYVLIYHEVPKENKDMVNVISGSVLGGLNLVLGWLFGAAKSSRRGNDDE